MLYNLHKLNDFLTNNTSLSKERVKSLISIASEKDYNNEIPFSAKPTRILTSTIVFADEKEGKEYWWKVYRELEEWQKEKKEEENEK